jgi:hypothetical protein
MAAIILASKLAHLLSDADVDEKMYVSVMSTDRLALGTDPMRPSVFIDLSKEEVIPYKEKSDTRDCEIVSAEMTEIRTAMRRMPRRSGSYWFELNGRRIECRSLKELLAGGLCHLEHLHPGMLDRLSAVKARSRRIVAHDPGELFEKEHLVRDHAEKLINGWWYGTNNSAQQTKIWLQRACAVSGVNWGREFKTSISAALEIHAIEL